MNSWQHSWKPQKLENSVATWEFASKESNWKYKQCCRCRWWVWSLLFRRQALEDKRFLDILNTNLDEDEFHIPSQIQICPCHLADYKEGLLMSVTVTKSKMSWKSFFVSSQRFPFLKLIQGNELGKQTKHFFPIAALLTQWKLKTVNLISPMSNWWRRVFCSFSQPTCWKLILVSIKLPFIFTQTISRTVEQRKGFPSLLPLINWQFIAKQNRLRAIHTDNDRLSFKVKWRKTQLLINHLYKRNKLFRVRFLFECWVWFRLLNYCLWWCIDVRRFPRTVNIESSFIDGACP